MPHPYVIRCKVNKTGPVDKVLYYAVPILSGKRTTNELAEYISQRCSLSRGDVLAVIAELGISLCMDLEEGLSTKWEGIGTFSLSATSEGYEDPKKCTPSHVKAKRICFKADPRLWENLKNIKFYKK